MNDKYKKRVIPIILLIIIIIIILLLLSKCDKKKHEPVDNPGNINNNINDNINDNKDKDKKNNKQDNIKKDDSKQDDTKKVDKDINIVPDNSTNNKKYNSNVKGAYVTKKDTGSENNIKNTDNLNNTDNNDGEIIVDWEQTSQLEIFYNEYFNDIKIAPGVNGDYTFDIKNSRGNKIKYNISLSDTNDYNINMKYRLKKGNEYIIGDSNTWVSIDELVYNNQQLDVNDSIDYTLEWIWEDANNDTNVGETVGANYSLTITVYGEDLSE